jgi:T-complex protein 1 subunit epsilon
MEVTSVEAYNALYEQEQKYFVEMVDKCLASGADVVMCQWGFDDEANHLLLQKGELFLQSYLVFCHCESKYNF